MAITPKSSGQAFETEQVTRAKQKDLRDQLGIFAEESKEEVKGQDAPLTDSDLADLGLLETPVEALGVSPQDQA